MNRITKDKICMRCGSENSHYKILKYYENTDTKVINCCKDCLDKSIKKDREY